MPARPRSARRRSAAGLLDRPWLVVGLVAAGLFVLWLASTRTQTHHLKVAFNDAVSVAPGQDVQVNGIDVGKVSGVELEDGLPIVELGIDDEDVWPLTRGTQASLRFGTTIGNGTRRVELFPGPADAPEIPDGGLISARSTTSPTEFDELFQTADAPTRRSMTSGQQRINQAVKGNADEIRADIRASAYALDAAGGFFGDLSADGDALREMVDHTDDVTRNLAARSDRIGAVLTVTARTFETFAANTDGIAQSLEQAPPALAETRATLARLEPSLDRLDALLADAAPGVAELRPLAASARPALADLRAIIPQALSTVRTARATAPQITEFLGDATPLLRASRPLFSELSDISQCVRPYAPELAGFLTNWSAFSKNVDQFSSYARVRVVEGDSSFTDNPDVKTSEFTSATGAGYAGLRPPGFNAGNPWFMPECGVGPDAVDPARDPEDDR